MNDPIQPPIVPGGPDPSPAAVAAPPTKKSGRRMIIGIATLGTLLLCCGVGVVAMTASDPDPSPSATGPAGLLEASPTAGPQEATPTLPPGTVTDTGTLLVGPDITPGTYRGVGCRYWERMKNADGELESILANGNVESGEHLTVTILKTDYAFDSSCDYLLPIASIRTVAKSDTSNEYGTLVVGKDIHPGTWRGRATDNCYWARLSGFTGDLGDILANDNVDAGDRFTITVKASDKGLHLGADCGPLTKG
jgi:hypothetical protein